MKIHDTCPHLTLTTAGVFQRIWAFCESFVKLQTVEAALAGLDSRIQTVSVRVQLSERFATTPWMGDFLKQSASVLMNSETPVHPLQAVFCFQHPRSLPSQEGELD